MQNLYKNDGVYAVKIGVLSMGEALNYVKKEWPSEDVNINIKGNKIQVLFHDYDSTITLAEYEVRDSL